MWETRHVHGISTNIKGEATLRQTTYVRPRPFNVMKIRQHKTFSKMIMPSEALIKLGIPTTDFKEIRDYNYGDPYKKINWKASARAASISDKPRVNTYEMEGKKVVWIYLNTARRMALGRETSNSLEYAVQAVLGLTKFYLSRNCNVGFNIFSDDLMLKTTTTSGGRLTLPDLVPDSQLDKAEENLEVVNEKDESFIIPDAGKRQELIINRRLLDIELGSSKYSLKQTVNKCRGHILGTNPLFIIVTSLNPAKKQQLINGLLEISKYTRRVKTSRPTTLIINILGYGLTVNDDIDEIAAEILKARDIGEEGGIRGLGSAVINWDPSKQSIAEVLLSQVSRIR
jgi:uncharacterized protein (DUF58 family)